MSHDTLAPRDIEDVSGPAFNCTTIANFASSQAQCARFLALTYHEQLSRAERDSQRSASAPIDPCTLAGGKALETYWAKNLAQSAQQLVLPRDSLGRCGWKDFLAALQPGVRAFAAEVVLQGQPSLSDSKVPGVRLSGGADFIEVQWDTAGRPTFHIYECKATSLLQASHLLQVVLYYMLIEQYLQQQGSLNLAEAAVPLDYVSIQCHLIRGDIQGFRVVGHEHRPLPQDEVRYLQGSLSPLLEHGSSSLERVTRMYQHNLWRQQQPILQGPAAPGLPPLLDPLEPALSFCVGAHCSTCSMQDKCVARLTHAGGELQLSGCSADQAEKLCAYWDEDHENGITSLLDLASAPLDTVRAALGLSRGSPVPEVLQASARVRSTRTAEGKGPGKYREVELRPRAGPSSLPVPVPGMVQVFVSAIVDSTFGGGGNVAGLAAKVVQVSGSHQPCLLSALVNDEHVSVTDELPNAAAPAAVGPSVLPKRSDRVPAGRSTMPATAKGVTPAAHSTVPPSAAPPPAPALPAAPAPAPPAMPPPASSRAAAPAPAPAPPALPPPASSRAAAAAAPPALPPPASSRAAAAAAAPPALPTPASLRAAAAAAEYEGKELALLLRFLHKLRSTVELHGGGQGKGILFHIYFHSNKQHRVLLTRCMHLASKHAGSPSIARELMWLPELLGQRVSIPGEQQMHSILELEICRFVTKWEGKDLATATQQQWLPGRGHFTWDGFGWPLTSDPPGCAQSQKLLDGLPPTLLWLSFHSSMCTSTSTTTYSSSGTSSSCSVAGNGCSTFLPDLIRLPSEFHEAAAPAKLHALLQQNVKAMHWLNGCMVDLGETPQMPVLKFSIPLPSSEEGAAAAAAPAAAAATTDELDAFCHTVRAAALLGRATEIHAFLVDRIFSRTPLQRALEDKGTSLVVWDEKHGPDAAALLPDGLTGGCLQPSGKFRYQLEPSWELKERDSCWLSQCSRGLDCCQLVEDVATRGLPVSVPEQQPTELEVDWLAKPRRGGERRRAYSITQQPCQPYFLLGTGFSIPELFKRAKVAILEKTGINIAGYTLQSVCERLEEVEDDAKVRSAAELLMLPSEPYPDPPSSSAAHGSSSAMGRNMAPEPPQFLQKQRRMRELLPASSDMNEDQKKALAWVLAPETRLQLLQGPPGTGKTETMAKAVLLAAAAALKCTQQPQEHVILVSAITRGAIEELKQRIKTFLLGARGLQDAVVVDAVVSTYEEEKNDNPRTCPTILGRTSNRAGEKCGKPAKYCSLYCGIHKGKTPDESPMVYILCGTPKHLLDLCKGVPKSPNLLDRQNGAGWLFIDEGSQMPLATLLALASMLQPKKGQLFVGGDHRQLPCIQAYDSSSDLRPTFLRYLPFSTAYDYLLEIERRAPKRVLSNLLHMREGPARVAVSRLTYSHRLPLVLRHLISPIYEQDKIRLDGRAAAAAAAAAAVGGSRGSAPGVLLGEAFRAVWRAPEGLFLVLHNSTQDGKRSPLELRIIERLLAERHGVADGGAGVGVGASTESVGIISPHKLQCADWQGMVAGAKGVEAAFMKGVEARTVDGYQGQQAASIIFSSTVSDLATLSANEAFYSSAHRVTVAFSRAVKRLVVICSKQLLDFLPVRAEAYDSMLLWRKLRAMCKDAGLLLGTGTVGGVDVSVFQGRLGEGDVIV